MMKLTLVNMVASVQLNRRIRLHHITSSNGVMSYESELFPAALITKWKPAHVAAFHNGKVILTGVTSIEHANNIANMLIDYLRNHCLLCNPK